MSKIRVFVSFDFQHDADLYERLLTHSMTPSSGFAVSGGSDRTTATDVQSDEVRSERVRGRIREADQVIVICGEHTEASVPMSAEIRIAREEQKPYILLWGRREIMCTKPLGTKSSEGMYSWTRQILQDQITLTRRNTHADAVAESRARRQPKGQIEPLP